MKTKTPLIYLRKKKLRDPHLSIPGKLKTQPQQQQKQHTTLIIHIFMSLALCVEQWTVECFLCVIFTPVLNMESSWFLIKALWMKRHMF